MWRQKVFHTYTEGKIIYLCARTESIVEAIEGEQKMDVNEEISLIKKVVVDNATFLVRDWLMELQSTHTHTHMKSVSDFVHERMKPLPTLKIL